MCTVSEDILELKSHLSKKQKIENFLLKEFATQLERTSPKLKKECSFSNFQINNFFEVSDANKLFSDSYTTNSERKPSKTQRTRQEDHFICSLADGKKKNLLGKIFTIRKKQLFYFLFQERKF